MADTSPEPKLLECMRHIIVNLRILRRLQSLYARDYVDLKEAAAAIRKEPALCARFLQLGKSAVFPGEFTSKDPLLKVITQMGDRAMKHEMAEMLHDAAYFRRASRNGFPFTKYQIHTHLFAATVVAFHDRSTSVQQALAHEFPTGPGSPVPTFVLHLMAMIHDIGKVVIAEVFPEVHIALRQRIVHRISDYDWPLVTEQELLAKYFPVKGVIDHRSFAVTAMKSLQYPESVVRALAEHHDKKFSSRLSRYFYLCHRLYLRELPFDPSNGTHVARVNEEVFRDLSQEFDLDRQTGVDCLSRIQQEMRDYLKFSGVDGGARTFGIRFASDAESRFSTINNAVFEAIEGADERIQLEVVEMLLEKLHGIADMSYTQRVYLGFDVVGHSAVTGRMHLVRAESVMKAYHDFVGEQLAALGPQSVTVIQAGGDSYILAFDSVESAIEMWKWLESQASRLSISAGLQFRFYYHMHAGRELKEPALHGGKKYSRVLNCLGHMMKSHKVAGCLVVSQAVYPLLDDTQRAGLLRSTTTEDGLQLYVEKRDRG
ncbi:MAG: hypothetical protein JW820_19910 [Spirochaetales bacterium]|nr:hypothetical protein [Spirochaetales bacterium]